MMARFYSRELLWSSLLALASACGSGQSKSAPIVPAPEVQQWLDRAQESERQRDYVAARRSYQAAIDAAHDPSSSALAHREMASALVFWGEYEGGISHLESSLHFDDSQVQVWHDLGVLQARSGAMLRARESLERALALAPTEPRTRIALAALLVKARDFEAAQFHYEALLELRIPPNIRRATKEALRILRSEIELQSHGKAQAPQPRDQDEPTSTLPSP